MSHPPKMNLNLELDKLKACIHCGMCLSACPTYRVTGSEAESPRGRLYLMRSMLEGELSDPQQLSRHLDPCLACHACETACPSGVHYGELLIASREALNQENRSLQRWVKRWILKHILPNHSLLMRLGSLLRFYQKSGLQRVLRKTGILKLLPGMAIREALLPEIPEIKKLEAGMTFGNPSGEKVALFTGCVMDVFYNPVHWDTIEVLVANGYFVTIPEQTCCGALGHHAGETDITRELALQNLKLLLDHNLKWIVVNSAGCGSTMKAYEQLLAELYRDRVREFSAKVVDVMELLAKRKLKPFAKPLKKTLTYHAACHLYHVQKIKEEPVRLLAQVPGLTLVPLTEFDACCGSAGVYNIEHPVLSQEILAGKIEHLKNLYEQTGAETVVTGNPGCMLQIAHGLQQLGILMSVRHPIEILAEAYRREEG